MTSNNDDYKRMGIECVRRVHEILESSEWKIEKVTDKQDTIRSTHRDKLGKIYRLTARLNSSPEALLEELFYRIENVPKWNPTLLESKIMKKIDPHTDITYQATIGGGGGVVKSRDFVNLRCWQLFKDGEMVDDYILNPQNLGKVSTIGEQLSPVDEGPENLETTSLEELIPKKIHKSVSDANLTDKNHDDSLQEYPALSKSLGAKDFSDGEKYLSDESLAYSDAQEEILKTNEELKDSSVFISAAISIDFPGAPSSSKYIRGENIVSCWAMREIPDQKDWCIFEWLLCLDLKGYIPRYILDSAYTSLMQDYMKFLRAYLKEIKSKSAKVPHNKS